MKIYFCLEICCQMDWHVIILARRFPNIYFSSHCFALIFLPPSELPSCNVNRTPPQKLPLLLDWS